VEVPRCGGCEQEHAERAKKEKKAVEQDTTQGVMGCLVLISAIGLGLYAGLITDPGTGISSGLGTLALLCIIWVILYAIAGNSKPRLAFVQSLFMGLIAGGWAGFGTYFLSADEEVAQVAGIAAAALSLVVVFPILRTRQRRKKRRERIKKEAEGRQIEVRGLEITNDYPMVQQYLRAGWTLGDGPS
jgi:membrane protein YdbS with pleckstrin-like domain